jgi:hypothetical protein
MGDGIAHIRCAPDGTIWAGYFDEGIFGGQDSDGNWPVSSSGIARFAVDGTVLWRFNDQRPTEYTIADCYSLTLNGNTAWCSPYTDFPIARIEGGVIRYWKNEIAGARAVVADADHVLLAGGYKDRADRIALLRLNGDRAELVGETRFHPPKSAAGLVQGQGSTLHIVSQGFWTQLNLITVRTALAAS